MSLRRFVLGALGVVMIVSCKTREAPELERVPRQKSEESQRNAILQAELQREKDAAAEKTAALEQQIEAVQQQLADEQKLSQQERDTLQDQLDAAERQRQQEMENLKELEEQEQRLEEAIQEDDPQDSDTADYSVLITYRSRVFFSQNYCLDLRGASQLDGARLIAYPCTYARNQVFAVEYLKSDDLRLRLSHSDKCLSVEQDAEAVASTPPYIVQMPCQGGDHAAEHFEFVDQQGDYDFKIKSRLTEQCFRIDPNGSIVLGDCANSFTLLRWGRLGY